MFNFPTPAGASGHLIGTALATTLVGPWVGILIISSILIVQAMFGDGGLLAFGANALNMAIIGAFTTWLIFYFVPVRWKESRKGFSIISAVAGFLSTMMMAFAASIELTIADAGPPGMIFGWMLGLHALIGLIEAVITFAIVIFVFKADISLLKAAEGSLYLRMETEAKIDKFRIPLWTLFVSIGVFVFMSIFGIIASTNPDGLERTFEKLGIEGNVTGFLSFGEGLGYDILQMFIIMIILFIVLIVLSYIMHRLNIYHASRRKESLVLSDES
jgi:cobalt/nickel transport system permease protein